MSLLFWMYLNFLYRLCFGGFFLLYCADLDTMIVVYEYMKQKVLQMSLRVTTFLSILVIIISTSGMVRAEEAPSENLLKAQSDTLKTMVTDLVPTLTRDEAAHFLAMYKNYTMYSMVKAVSEDIGDAVGKCSDNNKSMAGDLNDRFEQWDEAISATMKESFVSINNMAISQSYITQSKLKTMFGLIDEVRAVNSSRFETAPVTTPEACEFMMSKMDETEESMGRLLKETLVSYPNLLKAMQE